MNTKSKQTDPLLMALEYYDSLGLKPHLLMPKSKRPLKSGWTKRTDEDLQSLKREYRQGYGVGIPLGENFGNLVVIDMDIRSPNPKFLQHATAVIDDFYPGLRDMAACALTGRGFGSAHFYFRTELPVESKNLGRSKKMVKVYSPSSEASNEQERYVDLGRLTTSELKQGFRIKAAWEVDLMSTGKQVVAPPTRHPDTGRVYKWLRRLS